MVYGVQPTSQKRSSRLHLSRSEIALLTTLSLLCLLFFHLTISACLILFLSIRAPNLMIFPGRRDCMGLFREGLRCLWRCQLHGHPPVPRRVEKDKRRQIRQEDLRRNRLDILQRRALSLLSLHSLFPHVK